MADPGVSSLIAHTLTNLKCTADPKVFAPKVWIHILSWNVLKRTGNDVRILY